MVSRIGWVVLSVLVLGACAASEREPINRPQNQLGESNSISVTTLTSAEANDGWSRYDHAVELQKQGRTDAAVASYRDAEAYFSKSGDAHGSAVAIYGQAHTLDEAGRCAEADAVYHRYADLVKAKNPRASELAIGYAHECEPVIDARDDDQVNGWDDYNRAVAFDKAGRYEDAIVSYTRAEQRLMHDREHRALAIYGRARALTHLARCTEAARDYETYADLVRADNAHSANVALRVSRDCMR